MKLKIIPVLLLTAALAGCGNKNQEIPAESKNTDTEAVSESRNTETKVQENGKNSISDSSPDNGTSAEAASKETPKTSQKDKTAADDSETAPSQAQTGFPGHYSHKSKSGKITFDCRIELPDSFTKDRVCQLKLSGQYYGDANRITAKYVNGKEIAEEHPSPAQEGIPESVYYVMKDGSGIGVGNGLNYSSADSRYYSYAGVSDSDNQDRLRCGKVSFATAQDAIDAVKQELADTGFSEPDLQFEAYPLNHQDLAELEEQVVQLGHITADRRKASWTEEDDAYLVYAYQLHNGIPILHQWMSIYRVMAQDTPDNAPVTAVYSGRGIEKLLISTVYQIEDTQKTLALKDFDEIAGVVEEKHENILNDASYTVTRAKLFQMVHLNEKQEYAVDPVWYFEVMEDGKSSSVTLVNAVTGKEKYLQ